MVNQLGVAIVGAGPVGLSLALALLRRGIDVAVFEQRPNLAYDMRATTVQPRTLELLAEWRVLDEAVAMGTTVDRLQHWDWDKRQILAELDYEGIAADTSCPFRLHVSQPRLCEVLLKAIEAERPGTVRFGHTVEDFRQGPDHVTLEVKKRNGPDERVVASWLAAADGTNSGIRRALGVTFDGPAEGQAYLSCVADLKILEIMTERLGDVAFGPAAFLYGAQDWAIAMLMEDCVRFLLHAAPGVSPEVTMSQGALAARARHFLGDGSERWLNGLGHYAVRPRVASSWREGRVVLLGDAAHAAIPVGGTAMNGGMHDAYHLSVALAVGSEGALADYEERRRGHAEAAIAQAEGLGSSLNARGTWNRMTRNRALRTLADPDRAREHLLRVSMLQGRVTPVATSSPRHDQKQELECD